MKKYKNIFLLALGFIAYFFIAEFVMNYMFEDNTPFWKIAALGVVAGIGTAYPFFKHGKDFSFEMIKKKQRRLIPINKEIIGKDLMNNIIELLKENKFKITNAGAPHLKFKSRFSRKTFGENYIINLSEEEIILATVPRIKFLPFDSGNRYDQINLVEKEIISLCQNLATGNQATSA